MANSQTDSGSEEEYLYIRYPRNRVQPISTHQISDSLTLEPHSSRSPSRWSVHTSNFGSAVDNNIWYRDRHLNNRPTRYSAHTSDADSAIDDSDVISLQSLDDDTVPLLKHYNEIHRTSSAPAGFSKGQSDNAVLVTNSDKSHNHIWGEDKLSSWKRNATKRSFKNVLGKGLLHKLQKSNLKLERGSAMRDGTYLPVNRYLSSTMSFLDYEDQEPRCRSTQPGQCHDDQNPETQNWCNTTGKSWTETETREVPDYTRRPLVTLVSYKSNDTLRLEPLLSAAHIDGYQQDDRLDKSTQHELNATLDRNECIDQLPTTVTQIDAQHQQIIDESHTFRDELVRAISEPVMSGIPSGRTVQPTAATVIELYLSETSESPSTVQDQCSLPSQASFNDLGIPVQEYPRRIVQDNADDRFVPVANANPPVTSGPTSAKSIPTACFLQNERVVRVLNSASPPMVDVGRLLNKNTSNQPAKPIRYPVPPPPLSENDDGVLATWLRAQSEWRAGHCRVSTAPAEPTTPNGGSQALANTYRNYSPMQHRPLPLRPAAVIQNTIYAGSGWISPHPLSVASIEQRSPPQSSIGLPSGGRLTHARYLEMRNNAASPEMDEAGEVCARASPRAQLILPMPWDQNSR
nr:hypothetical protein CFP56_30070 [Quercus suber]